MATVLGLIIGASVSESHLGSSTRPLSVSLSVCLSIYNIIIYIYLDHSCHEFSNLIGQQQVHYFPYTPPFAILNLQDIYRTYNFNIKTYT